MRPAHAALLTFALAVASAGRSLRAQHETAADIQDGGRVFQNNCANCHGPDGDGIAGIDLGRGQFRRPMTDQDLVQIIRNGIPGTPMPASNFSEEQASHVVAYLRAEAAARRSTSAGGDAARGRALFEGKGGVRLVPPGQWRRLAARAGSDRHRPEAARRRTADLARRSGRRGARHQPFLSRAVEGRHDGHRPAPQPRHLLRPAARLEGAAALVREGGSPRPRVRREVADAVVQGQAERAGSWRTSSAIWCR